MADENLASIEHHLAHKKSKPKVKLDPKKLNLDPAAKKEIQTNFNLSFTNSFNTSYNNAKAPGEEKTKDQQILAFSSSKEAGLKPQYQGFFTPDAIFLEKRLTARL